MPAETHTLSEPALMQPQDQQTQVVGLHPLSKPPGEQGALTLRDRWRPIEWQLKRPIEWLRSRPIRLDQLLRGGEGVLGAAAYARHIDEPDRPSTPFADSPHVALLRRHLEIGDTLFEPVTFEKTAYFRNAMQAIETIGSYFSATTPDQICQVARGFVARFNNQPNSRRDGHTASRHSRPGKAPIVRAIRDSDCYEVVDGNHRFAIAHVRGKNWVFARVLRPAVYTPLQQLILDVAWCKGEHHVYQPVESPELGDRWSVVRRCDDRLDMMQAFLRQHGPTPSASDGPSPTYIDIACSYGWFVRAFADLGYDATGVEMDWASTRIGRIAYGLHLDKITQREVVRFLTDDQRRFDVVSCFSLVHHFILNRGAISAEQLIRRLDQQTNCVLFLDSGQEHEHWFKQSLAGWNPDRIHQWLTQHTTFREIHRLGTDRDAVGQFKDNYTRTLFACVR